MSDLLDGQHDCVYRLSWDKLAYQCGPENETRRQMETIAASHGHGTLCEPVPEYVAIPKARLEAYAVLAVEAQEALVLTPEIPNWDALMAALRAATEGEGT